MAPGFIDTHVHLLTGGARLSSVQLRDAKSRDEFVRRIADFARTVPEGTWITGGDWDHTMWGGELPSREWIDAAAPRHPVWLNRLDGHMALANSMALRAAKVTRETPDVAGGAIVRTAQGEPTGLLKDNAMNLVARVIPPRSEAMKDRALAAASQFLAKNGVTSVHNMGGWDDLPVLERAVRAGTLGTRVYSAVPLATWQRLADHVRQNGRGNDWVRIGGLKGFVDGSLGSHTAAFLEPYTDQPSDRGLFVNTPEKLYEWTAGAAKAGLHVMVHAIGDRAIRTQLDIFERVQREQRLSDPRFRIEHSQHIAPSDIARYAKSRVIASMQPYHAIDDGRWAEPLIGKERCRTTYAFRSLLDAGARIVFGSDWYVAPPSVLDGLYAAVTRRTLDEKNPGGWIPEQKITLEEAMRAYTADAAFASFEEGIKGTLEPGKLADLVVFDGDITRMRPEELRSAAVRMTVVDGRTVWESKSGAS